jgi:hypothetical protein
MSFTHDRIRAEPGVGSRVGGPRPSIATTFFTYCGKVPVYCSATAPPSECPTTVSGLRSSSAPSIAMSRTNSGMLYSPPTAHALSPWPRRSAAYTQYRSLSRIATSSHVRAWSRFP